MEKGGEEAKGIRVRLTQPDLRRFQPQYFPRISVPPGRCQRIWKDYFAEDFGGETYGWWKRRVEGTDPIRRNQLIDPLDIHLRWRMHKVSDGQRRRVQICMGLLQPFQVLLLDEVTVDLDVVARMDLLDFFKEECEQRGATIVYATHIFDGLETWATDLAYIQDGELKWTEKLSELAELKNSANLLSVVESWLRSETKTENKKPVNNPSQVKKTSPFDASPFRSSRHMAYYR